MGGGSVGGDGVGECLIVRDIVGQFVLGTSLWRRRAGSNIFQSTRKLSSTAGQENISILFFYVFNSKINYFPFFSPGPSHKLTFSILKSNFPDYNSIMWRDG